jgi:hypothetical protein
MKALTEQRLDFLLWKIETVEDKEFKNSSLKSQG